MEKIVSDERLHDYLRTYVKSIKLTAPKFRIIEGTNKGDNFVSLVYRVIIEGIENGEVKKIQFILKTAGRYEDDRILTSSKVTKMFQHEMLFYREILPVFKATLKGHGGFVDRFPDLYDYNDEAGKEVIMRFTSTLNVIRADEAITHVRSRVSCNRICKFQYVSFT